MSPVKIILDTNIHSDWASEPCRLHPSLVEGLTTFLKRPDTELIVPGELFVEFRWSIEKQARWLQRVGSCSPYVRIGLKTPVSWELDNAIAVLRGSAQAPFPLQRISSVEFFIELARWHRSHVMKFTQDILVMASRAENAAREANAKPEGMPKREYLRRLNEQHDATAEILASEAGLRQLESVVNSDDFKSSVWGELHPLLGFITPDVERLLDDTLKTSVEKFVERLRALRTLGSSLELDDQKQFMTLISYIDDSATPSECAGVFAKFKANPWEFPALGVICQLQRALECQRTRQVKRSDLFDVRLLSWLAMVNAVTTDVDMARIIRESGPLTTRGRVYSRREIGDLLGDFASGP
jgi:hypothetical protein